MNQRKLALAAIPLVLGLAASAGAQPPDAPYGYGPFPPPPDFPGYGMPFGAPPMERPPFMRVSRNTDANAYYVTVQLSGLKPEDLKVTVDGRWLVLTNESSNQESRQDTFDQGRGYSRSFSMSSGNMTRRMSLPQDADVSGLKREDSNGQVRITIPRRR